MKPPSSDGGIFHRRPLSLAPCLLLVGAAATSIFGCGGFEEKRLSGQDFSLLWELIRHQPEEGVFTSRLTLSNAGRTALPEAGWELYFNHARRIRSESVPGGVEVSQVNGDLYRLRPAAGFSGLKGGESLSVEYVTEGWITNHSGAPAGFYFVFHDGSGDWVAEAVGEERHGRIRTREQLRRSPRDNMEYPTPESRFRRQQEVERLPVERLAPFLPSPFSFERRPGEWILDRTVRIRHDPELASDAAYLAEVLEGILEASVPVEPGEGDPGAGRILLKTDEAAVDGREREAYLLTLDPAEGVRIVGSDPAGVFYGIQSLRALIPVEAYREGIAPVALPAARVEDAPRFGYRGMHLDVSRNFQSREAVLKLLELMSFYKLNRFHFHLTDDEGWRLEIRRFPELTKVGGRRGHTGDELDHLVPSYASGPDPEPAVSHGSGHYTREEFVEILRFAARRHIEVIPEIDVPGHARAAIRAMKARAHRLRSEGRVEEAVTFLLHDPEDRSEYRSVQGWNDNVVNVCRESTYRFLEAVVDEIREIYREAEATLTAVHIGGDEVPEGVWEDSPACLRLLEEAPEGIGEPADLFLYFVDRMNRLLSDRGLITAGWEEVALLTTGQGERRANPGLVGRGIRPYAWNSVWGSGGEENAYRLANAGYNVVLSNASNLYFDLAYDRHPEEPGYDWAGLLDTRRVWEFAPFNLYAAGREDSLGNPIPPDAYQDSVRLTPEGSRNIAGLQGQLWGETVRGPKRMEYMAFPRLIALAERAWTAERPWEAVTDRTRREREMSEDWAVFANTLGHRDLPRLDVLAGGVHYRLPPPGASLAGGLLRANVEFPGLKIRYTTDGTDPGPDAPLYVAPVEIFGRVDLRTFDTRGRRSRLSFVEP